MATTSETQLIRLSGENDYVGLYSGYGIRLIKGAYAELLRYPSMKEMVKNESRLEHGVRYITKGKYLKLNEKNFSIRFVLEGASEAEVQTRLNSFLQLIISGMFELKITTLGSVFRLVYKDHSSLRTFNGKYATFELKLTEPNPTDRSETGS